MIFTGAGLILIAIAVVVFAPRDGSTSQPSEGPGRALGQVNYPAPEFEVSDLDGNPISLADLQGKVVLVNNWATWCPPCRAEMPELEAYYQAHKGDGFVLVGINSGDKQSQVVEFIREYEISFPMWLDPTGLALHAFKNNALPSSYLVDESGTVRRVWTGAVSLETLEQYVTPLLED